MKSLKRKCKRVLEIIRELERRNALYQELDELERDLWEVPVNILKSHGLEIVDCFGDSNQRWKSVCMKRYELREVETKKGKRK